MDQPGHTSTNIFLLGFMGSGKTHWGRIWSANTGRSLVDLDAVIEQQAGKSIADIFETLGEDHFRQLEAAALRDCQAHTNAIIACGGGTPCFHNNMQWMNTNGITIFLSCTPQEVMKRVEEELEKRPLLKKLNKAELLFFIEQKMKEREPFYTRAQVQVQSHTLTAGSLPGLLNNLPGTHA